MSANSTTPPLHRTSPELDSEVRRTIGMTLAELKRAAKACELPDHPLVPVVLKAAKIKTKQQLS